VSKRGDSPSSKKIIPLSFEGEGDKGGEVENTISFLMPPPKRSYPYGDFAFLRFPHSILTK